jgi:hypothetical protein
MTFEANTGTGVLNSYGTRETNGKFGAISNSSGQIKQAVWHFSYNTLPVASTNATFTLTLPAGATPVEAYFDVMVPFVGGTSYDIDFVTSADAAIGSGKDKLWDGLALAEIDSTTTVLPSSTHAGTNSGNALNVPLASAGQLSAVATGTFTAGEARIIVNYIPAFV